MHAICAEIDIELCESLGKKNCTGVVWNVNQMLKVDEGNTDCTQQNGLR